MPYIPIDERGEKREPVTAGGLNFKLTEVIIRYLLLQGLSYRTCNDIVGALDNCKDEFKRRVQNPYEDRKIEANGDVYPREVLS
ncbi:hypothetical protein LCGC14_2504910 [marine sediment metagenome]|uniref:Uncharacterized protein n=1 Tax=marine sediment metagenome TaxID=412755 RepID=A0A0F8X6U4_9ZZZZ